MQSTAALLIIVVVSLIVLGADLIVNSRQRDRLLDDLRESNIEKSVIIGRLLEQSDNAVVQQATTFTQFAAAVSDATAKAVQSITYPDAPVGGQPATNDQLEPVRQMPIWAAPEKTLDYSDPTDQLEPDPGTFRPETASLEDGLGIPGFVLDPHRYDVV